MMRGLFAGCLAAFWLQFCHNLARKATPPAASQEPSAMEQSQIDAIVARCKTAAQPTEAHTHETVARWVAFVAEYGLPVVIIGRNQAVVPSLIPAPRRVH